MSRSKTRPKPMHGNRCVRAVATGTSASSTTMTSVCETAVSSETGAGAAVTAGRSSLATIIRPTMQGTCPGTPSASRTSIPVSLSRPDAANRERDLCPQIVNHPGMSRDIN